MSSVKPDFYIPQYVMLTDLYLNIFSICNQEQPLYFCISFITDALQLLLYMVRTTPMPIINFNL